MKKLVSIIKLQISKFIELLYWGKKYRFSIEKKAFLVGTPDYTNLGDSAIAIAQLIFLEKCGFKNTNVIEVTKNEFNHLLYYKRYIGRHHLICTIGGGNIGNQWYNEELFRYRVFDAFPDNPIIVFPQTVYFTDDMQGHKAIEDSYYHYENHHNLTIVAREKKSYNTLQKLYNNPKIMLAPDIVLSTIMSDYGVSVNQRFGVLLVFRSDVEKAMSDKEIIEIEKYLQKNSIEFRYTDMYADECITKENRMKLVQKKMQEIADSELVITDRLHGMVFAAITGTPCIAFDNNHHKVEGTYEWIKYLSYVNYVNTIEEAFKIIKKSISMNNCRFDNTKLLSYYNSLKKEIEKYV